MRDYAVNVTHPREMTARGRDPQHPAPPHSFGRKLDDAVDAVDARVWQAHREQRLPLLLSNGYVVLPL